MTRTNKTPVHLFTDNGAPTGGQDHGHLRRAAGSEDNPHRSILLFLFSPSCSLFFQVVAFSPFQVSWMEMTGVA